MITVFDNSHNYLISTSGELFYSIFDYAQNSILYIYPSFFSWFGTKIIPNLSFGSRILVASYSDSNSLTGYMILKTSPQENKICTLQVLPQFRSQGYGRQLLTLALPLLSNPIITVSQSQLDWYSSLLSEFSFSFIESIPDLYTKNQSELVFQKLS